MRELTTEWGCTLVMATATKPAFEQPERGSPRTSRWLPGTVREIIPDPAALHRALKRVSIEWRLDAPLRWEDLAGELLAHGQALCVVNLRDHAACVYDLLKMKAQAKGLPPQAIIHLSTRMCAKHRLEELARVRERLRQNLPCILVSTQLIEAGVDIDFPVGYRALGPMDAIFQVAGRVDREGRMTEQAGQPAGRLIVFLTEDGKTPPHSYKTATGITEALARTLAVQPDSLSAMDLFFERYYTSTELGEDMLELRKKLDFEKLADTFEMISSRAKNVLVPYGEGAERIEQLRAAGFLDIALLRSLQQYAVGLPPWEFERARQRVLYEIVPGSDLWACSPAAYDEQKGLLFEQSPEKMVV
jgi:CRISPR-associated endonuclease/helicase Cas3